jgi:hypothetical protein
MGAAAGSGLAAALAAWDSSRRPLGIAVVEAGEE